MIRAIFDSGFSHLEGLPWAFSLAALALCYFYAHYGFASLTAHISALYPGFLGAALAVGIPAPLAAWTLAFLSNLNAGLTHYGTGSAPVYFAGSYVSQDTWWAVGFVVSVVNLAIWLGLGSLWWSFVASGDLESRSIERPVSCLDEASEIGGRGISQTILRPPSRLPVSA